jgi:hypothetical protein
VNLLPDWEGHLHNYLNDVVGRASASVADYETAYAEYLQLLVAELEPTHIEGDSMGMIEVGKVVTREGRNLRHTGNIPEESVRVMMDEDEIYLSTKDGMIRLPLPKAIELGQMVLKAAEAQVEYAAAAKELAAQKAKLDAKYKDLVSGLGLENLTDRLDENGGLKVING